MMAAGYAVRPAWVDTRRRAGRVAKYVALGIPAPHVARG